MLCEDGVEPLVAAMEQLMGNRALRVQMGKAAKEAMAQYAPARIWDQWEELINSVVQAK